LIAKIWLKHNLMDSFSVQPDVYADSQRDKSSSLLWEMLVRCP